VLFSFFSFDVDEVTVEVSSVAQRAFLLSLSLAERPAEKAWKSDLKRFAGFTEREAKSPVVGVALEKFSLAAEDPVCAPVLLQLPALHAALTNDVSYKALVEIGVTDDAQRSGWAIGGNRVAVRVTVGGPTTWFGPFLSSAWRDNAGPWIDAAVTLAAALGTESLGITEPVMKRIEAGRAAEAERRVREERDASNRKAKEEREKAEKERVASLSGGACRARDPSLRFCARDLSLITRDHPLPQRSSKSTRRSRRRKNKSGPRRS
jgi:hypothetical protein